MYNGVTLRGKHVIEIIQLQWREMFELVVYCLALVVSSSGEADVTSLCTLAQVKECTKGFDTLGSQIAPDYTSEELDLLCRKWVKTEPCLLRVDESCQDGKKNRTEQTWSAQIVITHKRAEQATREWIMGYKHLCSEGRTGYAIVEECMSMMHNLTALAEECYNAYNNQTWWLKADEPINSNKFCKAARNFFACLRRIGKEWCSEEFSDWVWNYQEQLWHSHLHSIDCHVAAKFAMGELTMLSLCGATVIFCFVITTISYLYQPEKKPPQKKRPQTKQTSFNSRGITNPSFVKDVSECQTGQNDAIQRKRSNEETHL